MIDGQPAAGWESQGGQGRWRRMLPVAALLAAGAVAGVLISPGAHSDSGAVLDIEMDLEPTPAPGATGSAGRREEVRGPAFADIGSPPADPTQVPGEWRVLPPAPLDSRIGYVSAWTDAGFVVWGGTLPDSGDPLRPVFAEDGAIYDPGEDTWRRMPASPLAPRQRAAAVWTGTEVLIWGGGTDAAIYGDGAAYNPSTDRWRMIATPQLAPRFGAAAVWSGREMLVFGGFDRVGPTPNGAAYDPSLDSWRPLDLPDGARRGAWHVGAERAGDAALLWVSGDPSASPGAVYDVAADRWAPLPALGEGSGYLQRIVPIDGGLLAVVLDEPGQIDLLSLPDGEDAWLPAHAAPQRSGSIATVEWTDAGLVLMSNVTKHWLYQPASDSWVRLPDGPPFDGWWQRMVWTGQELLIWGDSPNSGGARRDWIFRFVESG